MNLIERTRPARTKLLNTCKVIAGQQVRKPHIATEGPAYVFVSGIMGTGEQASFEHIVPYWGLFHGDLLMRLEEHGYECYAATVGPVSSAWDRACELYALLCGGTVDYGAAHSEKYGHARFGRTYSPMFPGWSREKPVHLLGHSFGGATVRLFAQLCAEGSGEERAATPPEELSPLFAGGMLDRVLSITCLASPHNGTTAICSIQKEQRTWTFMPIFSFLSIAGTLPALNGIYDLHLEHFGLSNPSGKFVGNFYSPKKLSTFLKSRDHAPADLSLDGAEELNERVPARPELYYFSYPCVVTTPRFTPLGGRELPPLKEIKDPVMLLYGLQMGLGRGWAQVKRRQEDGTEIPDPYWLQNDGAVPLASARYPFRQPYREFDPEEAPPLEPGVWNVMPTHYGVDHGYYCGWDVNKPDFEGLVQFYLEHFQLLGRACETRATPEALAG